jgi:RNA polymerase sigma-70 factor (ECF subfamily)
MDGSNIRQDEFLRLFSQHSRRIYEFILTLVVNHSDADEVFQNTSVILWRKFDTYDPNGSFPAWACRIAYLEILQLRRTSRRMQTFSDEVLELLVSNMMAEGSNINLRYDALGDCLNKLASDDRALIERRYYHQCPPKEIARAESVSVHTIYRSLARVHRLLRACIDRTVRKEQLA